DGRYVVFASDASNLVAGDTNGIRDIFLKDVMTGEITRINSDTSNTQADLASSAPSISADGKHVAFDTLARNLLLADLNLSSDVFIATPVDRTASNAAPTVTAIADEVQEDAPYSVNLLTAANAHDADAGDLLRVIHGASTVTTSGGRTLALG